MVITWNTRKTEAGFAFRVYTIGYQVTGETLKEGVCASRAQATLLAKKWARHLKSEKVAA